VKNLVEKELVNFNVDVSLKKSFMNVCKLKGSNMTTTFVDLIKGYVKSESENIKKDFDMIENLNKGFWNVEKKMKERKYEDNRISFFKS
jgi:hypothetical protein